MKAVEAEIEIEAPPSVVWQILTDQKQLVDGGLGIVELTGDMSLGGKMQLRAEIDPKRVFKLKVADFQPEKQMVWVGGMPFGLFTGARTFTLRPLSHGTHFHMRETFTGALSGMIWKAMPDLQPSFRQFVQGVKSIAERTSK